MNSKHIKQDHTAAVKIQSVARGKIARKTAKEKREEERRATDIKLQKYETITEDHK